MWFQLNRLPGPHLVLSLPYSGIYCNLPSAAVRRFRHHERHRVRAQVEEQQKGVIAQPLTTRARLGEGISIQEDSRSVCARRAPLLVTHLRAGRGEPDDVLGARGGPQAARVPQVPRRLVPAEPGSLANVLEHLPDAPRTQRCTSGRGEYPADVLPTGSGSRLLGRLVRLPLPERPDGHLGQLDARRDLGVMVSLPRPGPRAAPRPTEDCRLGRRPPPSYSPGLPLGASQSSGSRRCSMHQRGRTPRILQPCVPLQCR